MNNQQITDRFTTVIWPAIAAYNENRNQGAPPSQQYHAVVDPTDSSATAYGPLRDAVWGLGRAGEYESATQTTHGNDGLTLGHVDVQSVQGDTATLNVCYTYTHWWYVNIADTQRATAASEATVGLVNVDHTWYLHSITDDHVVPGCGDVNS
ncbi:hypothetical protein [Mycolicibacter virginiensis]|uniref:hypothetical protein n=1 Tax=Mycolicibacter virginiensis TaxID=1795032 RepID=UPI001F03870D|nr:hypothetical protein [Mycolicibacter virginiensis]ULP48035.1 hypothetical protein MJO54_02365 [Mycolicibacter virginiensis]